MIEGDLSLEKRTSQQWSETVQMTAQLLHTKALQYREDGGRTARVDAPWSQVIWMRREEGWFRITEKEETDVFWTPLKLKAQTRHAKHFSLACLKYMTLNKVGNRVMAEKGT